ncbi:hypothetical protein Q1695_000561 [Nippostrongylus brasiliensis]|nr:hypothetical protein Q1695_000561 [Nippostrongylus brasiliensis]
MSAKGRRHCALVYKDVILSGNNSYLEIYSLDTFDIIQRIRIENSIDIRHIVAVKDGVLITGNLSLSYVPEELFRYGNVDYSLDTVPLEKDLIHLHVLNDHSIAGMYDNFNAMHAEYSVGNKKVNFGMRNLQEQPLYQDEMISTVRSRGNAYDEWVLLSGSEHGNIYIHFPWKSALILAVLVGPHMKVTDIKIAFELIYAVSCDGELTVWDDSILEYAMDISCYKRVPHTAVVVGHVRAIRCLCIDDEGYVFTVGDDKASPITVSRYALLKAVLRVWTCDGKDFELVNERDLNAGKATEAIIDKNILYISFDSSALIAFHVQFLRQPHVKYWTCPQIRSFTRLVNRIFLFHTDDGCQDEAEKCFRYLKRSPTTQEDITMVSFIGRKYAVFQQETPSTYRSDQNIVSLLIHGRNALVYKHDNTADLLFTADCRVVASFDFKNAAKELGLGVVHPTAIFLRSIPGGFIIMLGTASGHLFNTSFKFGELGVVARANHTLNKYFSRKTVNEMFLHKRLLEHRLSILCNNGCDIYCAFDFKSDDFVKVLSSRLICPYIDGFRPKGFSADGMLVVGFRDVFFYIVDFRRGEIVYKVNCGGPTGQWLFQRGSEWADETSPEQPSTEDQISQTETAKEVEAPKDAIKNTQNKKKKKKGKKGNKKNGKVQNTKEAEKLSASQLRAYQGSMFYCFDYLQKNVLNIRDIEIRHLRYICEPCHLKTPYAIRILAVSVPMLYGVSIGLDCQILFFRFHAFTGAWYKFTPIYTRSIPTCMDGLALIFASSMLVVVGSDTGVITGYLASTADYDHLAVPSVEYKREGNHSRVLSLHITNMYPVDSLSFHCVACYADGTILCLDIKVDVKSCPPILIKNSRLGPLLCFPEHIVKMVRGWSCDSDAYVCGISSKELMMYAGERESISTIEIAGCDRYRLIAMGSSVGKVAVYHIQDGRFSQRAMFKPHTSGVAAIAMELVDANLVRIFTIFNDGVFTVHEMKVEGKHPIVEVRRLQTGVLYARDIVTAPPLGTVVVGDGVEFIEPKQPRE